MCGRFELSPDLRQTDLHVVEPHLGQKVVDQAKGEEPEEHQAPYALARPAASCPGIDGRLAATHRDLAPQRAGDVASDRGPTEEHDDGSGPGEADGSITAARCSLATSFVVILTVLTAPVAPAMTAATLTSMNALDDKVALEDGDTVSFRVIEDRDDHVRDDVQL